MYTVSIEGLEKARAKFGDRVVNQALTSTVNKLSDQALTATKKAIRTTYRIKAKDLVKRGTHNRKGMYVRRAKFGEDVAFIFATGSRLPTINFYTNPKTPEADFSRKRRRGISVSVRRDTGNKRLRHAFVARMKSGHVGVFERIDEKRSDGRDKIRQLHSPSVAQMFDSRESMDAAFETIGRRSQPVFEHELDHYFQKAAGLR